MQTKTTFGHLFCVFWLSLLWSVDQIIYASAGFQKYQKIFNQKIYPRERCDSNKCFVLLWTCLYKKANHLSLNNHFVPLLKLLISTENKLKGKHGLSHRENMDIVKLEPSLCQKCKRKSITFFLKNFQKNTETTEQEQNKLKFKRNKISWTLCF